MMDMMFITAMCLIGGSISACIAIFYNEYCCNRHIQISSVVQGNTAPNTPESSTHNDILDQDDIEIGYLNESK